jgi:PAS domain S-box-containing protein
MATILVADDREQERQYLVVLLRHAGHDVVEAEDGLDAIAKISTTAPDLVIADLLMPTMDGFELIRQLRERPETRNTPIVLYTSAYDEVETQALVEHYAAATILPKPSEPEVLLRTIGRILGEALPNRLPFGDDFRHAHLELVTTKLHSKISDLERANSELVQKESQLRLVTNAVPVLISLIDTDLHVQFANQAHQEWFHRSPEEIRSKHLMDVWGSEAYSKLSEYRDRALRGETVTFATSLTLGCGARKFIRATYVPELGADGRILGFVALVQDLSEIKAVEAELVEEKTRLEIALAAGSIGTWDFYPLTGELCWDARCKAAFGLPPDAAVDYEAFVKGLHPEDRERVTDEMQAALDPAGSGHFDAEYRTVGASYGLLRHVHSQGQALFELVDDERRATRFVGTIQDITARKRGEDRLHLANENLRQFAYAAAHDLQEPLRNISISLSLLQRALPDEPTSETGQLMAASVADAKRMIEMIKGLLTLSGIEDREGCGKELIDSNELLTQVLKNLGLSIAETGARIKAGPLPMLCMASAHFIQLFQNLIGNSLKYRKTRLTPEISISASRQGTDWLFTVADNGIGFDPAYAERIFGLFKRLHQKHEYSGTGIGLALCSRIVATYGGRIWAESAADKGAIFRFTVPALEEDFEVRAKRPTKILVIEDNPLAAQLVSYALKGQETWATEIVLLEDGAEAARYLTQPDSSGAIDRPDLVLLDVDLRKRDGMEVLRVMRTTNRLWELPVFLLTSSPEDVVKERVLAANLTANQYLTKPTDEDGCLALGKTLRRLYYEALLSTSGDRFTLLRDLKSSQSDLKTSRLDLKESQSELRTSQDDLKSSRGELRTSQSELESSQSELETSRRDLKESQTDFKTSQDDLKDSQGELRTSRKDLTESRSDLRASQDDLKSSRSELKTSQGELKSSQTESYHRLLELEVLYGTAPVGLAFLDRELRYVRLNEAFAEINDLPVEDHLGRYAMEINPGLAKMVVPMMERAIASNKPLLRVEIESPMRGDATRQRTWMVNLHPVTNASIFGVSVVFNEITALKEAEYLRTRFSTIVESSDDAMISMKLDGAITSWNRAAEEMLAYSAEEVVGKAISILATPDRSDELPDILARLQKGESVYNYETVQRRKDGGCIDVSLTISPIHDQLGRVIGAAETVRDITRQKRSTDALQRSNEELRQFAFVAAHDLQEPLREIMLSAQMLNAKAKQNVNLEEHEHLTTVNESAGRMQRLIKDLMAYTEFVNLYDEQGRVIDCSEACRTALDNLSSVLNASFFGGKQWPRERAGKS